MSNYTNLRNGIISVIKTNGNNEITGQLLQNELLAMITTLGYGYQFMGVASPNTVPGTPDAKVFYIAYTPGTYTNFNGISVTGLCVLKYATSWVKEDIPVSGGGGGTEFTVEPTDLTLVSGTPNKLKFADRLHESNITTGLNYIILRETGTFSGQVSVANAIYEIRYEFDLGGASVDLPANCVLYFNGGKLSNGTIVGNNTCVIIRNLNACFNNVNIGGSWLVPNIYSNWFSSTDETVHSTILNCLNMNNSGIHTNIYINGNYSFAPQQDYASGNIRSNTDIYINGTISKTITKDSKNIFRIDTFGENVGIYGGTIIGDLEDSDTPTSPDTENGHGIICAHVKHVRIAGVTFKNFTGDGICLSSNADNGENPVNEDVIISGCTIDKASRNGITVIACNGLVIENTTIKNISRRAPQAALDLEANYSYQGSKNIIIRNCKCTDCLQGIVFSNHTQADVSGILLENNYIECATLNITSYIRDLIIRNNVLKQTANASGAALSYFGCKNVLLSGNTIETRFGCNNGAENFEARDNIITSTAGSVFTYPSGRFIGNKIKNTGGALFAGSDLSLSEVPIQLCIIHDNAIEATTVKFSKRARIISVRNNHISIGSNTPAAYMIEGTADTNDDFSVNISNNFLDLDANTRMIQFWPGKNITIEDNVIKFRSNKPGIYIDGTTAVPSVNNLVRDNIYILPSGYTSRIFNGELLSSTKNRAGFMMFNPGMPAWWDGSKWINAAGYTPGANNGATASRPTLAATDIGFTYFDTTLGKMIVWNGTAWVNVDGSALS